MTRYTFAEPETSRALAVIAALFYASASFTFEPLPDGVGEITVKDEHVPRVRAVLDATA